MVDSNYKLSLDSINSDVNLSLINIKTPFTKKIIMILYHTFMMDCSCCIQDKI
jgi:hypothetical protein